MLIRGMRCEAGNSWLGRKVWFGHQVCGLAMASRQSGGAGWDPDRWAWIRPVRPPLLR